MKRLSAVVAGAFLALGLFAGPALADHREVCETVVVEEAWTEVIPAVTEEAPIQRYSYTGGPQGLDENGTPVQTTAPGSDWQANTTLYNDGTSHGGNLGLYFVSHGNSGNGDWFYWEVGTVVVTPEQTIEHDAVTKEVCEPVKHDDPKDPKDPRDPREPKDPKDKLPKDLAFTGPMSAEAAAAAFAGLLALGSGALYFVKRRTA